MICVHCGKEIDNGQDFCPYCGGRVGSDAATEAKAAKKDPRKLALPMVAVALLAVVGVGLANRKPSIDLQRYVTITAQGYDTLGKLDVAFDTDKLEADYGKRIADSFKKAMNDHKESTYGLSSLACWLTAHLYCSAQDEALAHMRHVRDEIAEELGRTIEPHDEYDLAFHQAKPWLEDHKSTPGTAAAKGGRSHASRHHSYGEGLPFPFEGGDITAPFLVGPWERPLNAQAIFPSQIGAAFPREYEHLCPEMPGAELEQGLLHGATRAYPPKELPEMDYASRQPFLKDIQFTKENGGKTKKALDLLSKGLYYATMASSFVVLLMWGAFCGLFGAKSAPFFVLVNMHDGQRDAIAHMFIDRCAHDLKTHRYKPLLAPGIALTLIYCYLEYLSRDPYFWLTRVFRFVYNPLSWICFFLFAGLLVLDAVHAAKTYKQYRHLENTIGAAVYFYLFKMARVPGKIGFAVGLMLIMNIFGNYPYLFPIMVTGWLAMQACSKMVTGSADLKD